MCRFLLLYENCHKVVKASYEEFPYTEHTVKISEYENLTNDARQVRPPCIIKQSTLNLESAKKYP